MELLTAQAVIGQRFIAVFQTMQKQYGDRFAVSGAKPESQMSIENGKWNRRDSITSNSWQGKCWRSDNLFILEKYI